MSTPVASLNYDPAGDGSFGGWDNLGRIVQQTWKDPAASLTLDGYGYSYDNAGNLSAKTNTLNSAYSESYTHDGLDRLIDAQRGGAAYQSWDLDQVGNWSGFVDQGISQSRTTDSANQITSISGSYTPLYDAAGNMLAMPRPGDPTQYLGATWDAWNRMTAASGQSSQQQYAYEYDGLNRRISKTVGTGEEAITTEFYYNENWQVLEEVASSPSSGVSSRTEYVWDVRYIDSPVVRFHDANADGDLEDVGDSTLYYLTDANWNVTALVDGTEGSSTKGQVVERYVYDPYGNVTVLTGNWQPATNNSSAYSNAIRFGGYRFDAETGLYQVRNRYLHVTLGWISRDPEGYVDGMNLQAYAGSSPTDATDPLGLATSAPTTRPSTQEASEPEPLPVMEKGVAPNEAEWKILKRWAAHHASLVRGAEKAADALFDATMKLSIEILVSRRIWHTFQGQADYELGWIDNSIRAVQERMPFTLHLLGNLLDPIGAAAHARDGAAPTTAPALGAGVGVPSAPRPPSTPATFAGGMDRFSEALTWAETASTAVSEIAKRTGTKSVEMAADRLSKALGPVQFAVSLFNLAAGVQAGDVKKAYVSGAQALLSAAQMVAGSLADNNRALWARLLRLSTNSTVAWASVAAFVIEKGYDKYVSDAAEAYERATAKKWGQVWAKRVVVQEKRIMAAADSVLSLWRNTTELRLWKEIVQSYPANAANLLEWSIRNLDK